MFEFYNALHDTARAFASSGDIWSKIIALLLYAADIIYGLAMFLFPFNVWSIATCLSRCIVYGERKEDADE